MKIDKHTIKSHIPKTFKSLNVGAVFEAEVVDIMENEIKLKAFDGTIIRSKYNKIGFKIGEKTDFIITNKTKEGLVEIEEVRTDVKRVDKVLEKLLLERLPINETILKRIKYFMKNEEFTLAKIIYLMKNKVDINDENVKKFKNYMNLEEKIKNKDQLSEVDFEFANKLNDHNALIYIPYKFNDKEKLLKMYFLHSSNKVVLNLDFEIHGEVEVLIHKKEDEISLKFYCETKKFEKNIKKHIHELENALEYYNIKVSNTSFDFEKFDPFKFENKKKKTIGIKFDMRV